MIQQFTNRSGYLHSLARPDPQFCCRSGFSDLVDRVHYICRNVFTEEGGGETNDINWPIILIFISFYLEMLYILVSV